MIPVGQILGLAWGGLLSAPLVAYLIREASRRRTRMLRSTELRPAEVGSMAGVVAHVMRPPVRTARVRFGVFGRVASGVRTHRWERRMTTQVRRDLPVTIDVLGVAIGAGLTPYLSVEGATRWIPTSVAQHFEAVVYSVGRGMRFSEAIDHMALGTPVFRPVADALLSSERLGAPVAVALERLATEARADARRQAETRARKVPVRLLFPLVFLVLPAFVLLTVVPALVAGTR